MSKRGDPNILSVRNSRKAYLLVYLMVLILIIALIIFYIKGYALNKIAIFSSLFFVYIAIKSTEIHRLNNRYEIKPTTLTHVKGIINKVSKKVDLASISNVDIRQNLWNRMLGFGNVNVFICSGAGCIEIKNINSPHRFAEFLEQKMADRLA